MPRRDNFVCMDDFFPRLYVCDCECICNFIAEIMHVKLLSLCSRYQIRTIVWWWWKNMKITSKNIVERGRVEPRQASESLLHWKAVKLAHNSSKYTATHIHSFLPITHENNWDHVHGDKSERHTHTIYMDETFLFTLQHKKCIQMYEIGTAENWFISSTSTSSALIPAIKLHFITFNYVKWF